jgi:S1-C subfamily serine protease
VAGLAKGSAADRAGLKDGDVILNSVDLTELRNKDDLPAVFRIRRGDKEMKIE